MLGFLQVAEEAGDVHERTGEDEDEPAMDSEGFLSGPAPSSKKTKKFSGFVMSELDLDEDGEFQMQEQKPIDLFAAKKPGRFTQMSMNGELDAALHEAFQDEEDEGDDGNQ